MNNNVKSNFYLSKFCSEFMNKGSSIVFISSTSSMEASIKLGCYAVSKGALNTLTKQLALEYKSKGIRVNAISPGLVKTHFARMLWDVKTNPKLNPMALKIVDPCESEEIAGVAYFLANSQLSSGLIGQNLVVDHGLTSLGVVSRF
jgi:NAD(P)-dependent dehydrogenase (short-subunit alcohol dehydrogenase family)